MTRVVAAVVLAVLLMPCTGSAQMTDPVRYTWIATSCTSWNCAASALVLAGGDRYTIALPTSQEDRPWVILRRVEEGSIFIPEDEPFQSDVFGGIAAAGTYFDGLAACHAPIVLSVPDGRAVVISLTKCPTARKQRAVR